MSAVEECQKRLIELAEKQGYLTFDDIIDISDTYSLSISQVDIVSEAIQLRNIKIYEDASEALQANVVTKNRFTDSSSIDYEKIFSDIAQMSDSMKELVDQIRLIVPPQRGEFDDLIVRVKQGDMQARDRCINMHLRNVLKIVLTMVRRYEFAVEDAIAEGTIGLIEAVDNYDLRYKGNFYQFSGIHIRKNILEKCIPEWLDSGVVLRQYDKIKILQVDKKCREKGINWRDNGFIETSLGIDLRQIEKIEKIVHFVKCQESLEEVEEYDNWIYDEDEEIVEREELSRRSIFDEDEVFNTVARRILREELLALLKELDPRTEKIIRLYYGFETGEEMTLTKVASYFKITRNRIQQLEKRGLRILRNPLLSQKVKEFLSLF